MGVLSSDAGESFKRCYYDPHCQMMPYEIMMFPYFIVKKVEMLVITRLGECKGIGIGLD